MTDRVRKTVPPPTIRSLFEQAGWVPGRQVPVSSRVPDHHPAHAVLSSFSGLRVGSTGEGLECAASDIEFRDEDSQISVETRWGRHLSSQLIFVGYQHNEHGTLFIDSRGRVFGESLIHEAFWLDGEDVWTGIENVLLGRRSRPVLDPSQNSVSLYGELYTRGDPRIFSPSARMTFRVGDKVVKNPATWEPNAFDEWGRGEGVGVVVEPPFDLDGKAVDVRWPNGRCFEDIKGLLPAPRND